MKQVAELITKNQKATTQKSQDSFTPLADRALNRFFAVMQSMYDQKWTSRFTDEVGLRLAQEQWAKMLSEFSMDDIKRGLDRCIIEYPSWPPTIGEFRLLCQIDPTEAGLPSASDAWTQICVDGQKYSHGIVLAARNDPRCDVFNWRLKSMEKGLKHFEPIYREYLNRAMSGEEFPLPVMIENKKDRPVTWGERQEHAKPFLNELHKALK